MVSRHIRIPGSAGGALDFIISRQVFVRETTLEYAGLDYERWMAEG
jgi:hypothetical protein